MSELPFSATTPVSVAKVGLKARNAEALASYYRDVVGLEEISRDGGVRTLGAAGRPLLEIVHDPAAGPDDPRSAGLFHTAFLLPRRADLGRWIRHAIDKQTSVDGASDHLVSEALYLTDPEGNGIEIYADRPKDTWPMDGDQVRLATLPLDTNAIVAEVPAGDAGWRGAPAGSIIGHVHLRVGEPKAAETWWHDNFGFDTVARYGNQAVFLSSGGYHHHIGVNSWQSHGARRRDNHRSGLTFIEMRSALAAAPSAYEDPWGTVIRSVPGAAGT